MRALRLLGPLFAAALALPGCYETPTPACAFLCGADGACPDGYTCRADSWCRRQDVADDVVCALPLSDAAPVSDATPAADASTFDASTPDASTPDASTPDAAPFDASPPDASTPDAAPPDAAPIDAATLAGS